MKQMQCFSTKVGQILGKTRLPINSCLTTYSEFFKQRSSRELLFDELIRFCSYPVHLSSDWLNIYVNKFKKRKDSKILVFQTISQRKVIGYLPFEIRYYRGTRLFNRRRIYPLGTGPSDFFDIPCCPGFEKVVAGHVATWLKKNFLNWDSLRLDLIPESSSLWSTIVQSLEEVKFSPIVNDDQFFYKIDTTKNWADYQRLMKQHTHDLKNRLNRVERENIELRVKYVRRNISHYWDGFYRCYEVRRSLRNQNNSFETLAGMEDFIKSVIGKFESLEKVQLSILYGDENIWAYQLDWIDQGVWYHYMPTFNQEYEKYSPGKILLSRTIEEAFHRPEIREFNFMRGQSSYKSQFAWETEKYISIYVENPFSFRNKSMKLAASLVKIRDFITQIKK